MCIDFMTGAGQTIRTEQVGTVVLPLSSGKVIELRNVALARGCDSNLLSLGQLRESGITYRNDPSSMTLMKVEEIIAHAKRSRNLFILDRATPGKVMVLKGRGRPTHLVS